MTLESLNKNTIMKKLANWIVEKDYRIYYMGVVSGWISMLVALLILMT